MLLDAGANKEAKDKVRMRRVGDVGGWEKNRGCVSCFLGELQTRFCDPSNLAYGRECRRSSPERSFEIVSVEWILYNGRVKQLGKGWRAAVWTHAAVIAAQVGREAVVQVLLQAGLDTKAVDPVRARWGGEGTVEKSSEPFLGLLKGTVKQPELACIGF